MNGSVIQGGSSEFQVKGTKKKASEKCEDYSVPADTYGNRTDCILE